MIIGVVNGMATSTNTLHALDRILFWGGAAVMGLMSLTFLSSGGIILIWAPALIIWFAASRAVALGSAIHISHTVGTLMYDYLWGQDFSDEGMPPYDIWNAYVFDDKVDYYV